MDIIKEKKIYDDIIEVNGRENQFGIFSEELGEALTVVNQFRRGRKTKEDVIEELGDATIMIRQILVMLGLELDGDELQNMINLKLKRLEGRIEWMKTNRKKLE